MDFNLTEENYSKTEVEEMLNKFIPKEKSETEKQLDIKLSELAKKERLLSIREAGLPTELCEYLTETADLAKFTELIKTNANYVPSEHKKAIDGMTKEKFDKLSYSKRAELYEQNPELVKNLF